MSYDETIPRIPRPRDASIDLIKLDLMNLVSNLSNQVILARTLAMIEYDVRRRYSKKSTEIANRRLNHVVPAITDQLEYILEIAKNLLTNPKDPENFEYKKFEDYALSMIEGVDATLSNSRQLTRRINSFKINRT